MICNTMVVSLYYCVYECITGNGVVIIMLNITVEYIHCFYLSILFYLYSTIGRTLHVKDMHGK